jgi:nitroimidazol reductase NimA-like FMN-containing flavoprotein (pyridoxamine 5'-phosphate oxidase superfamily)
LRRSEREITDFGEIVALLGRCPILRVAMFSDGWPYIVPVNFGFETAQSGAKKYAGGLSLFFHSAPEGKKIDALRSNPRVCFETDANAKVMQADVPCKWTESYESVIGFGTARLLDTTDDKRRALNAIMRHAGLDEENPHYNEASLSRMVAVRIDVESVTGKRNL